MGFSDRDQQNKEEIYGCQREGGRVIGKMGEGEWGIQGSNYGMKKSSE